MADAANTAPALNVEVLTHDQLAWVYVERPTPAEVDYLHRLYGLHPVHLAECLSRRHQPKLVDQPASLFLVLGFPIYNKLARTTSSGELDVFVGANYLVTLHRGEARTLARLFRDCQGREERRAQLMGRGSGYLLYAIADQLVGHSLQIVESLASNVRSAEEALLVEDNQELVQEIAFLRRDVAALSRIVRPQASVLAALARSDGRPPLLGEELSVYWSSLADRLGYISGTLDSCREAVDGLAVADDSLAARRTGEAIRLLAIVSTTALPLVVLAALFGINVRDIPLASHPYAFELILAAMAAIVVGVLYLFRRRRWL